MMSHKLKKLFITLHGKTANAGFRALGILACLVPVMALSQPLVLVENNHPRSAIITAQGASESVRMAASEMQSHVWKATGALLPLRTVAELDSVPAGHVRILVGPSALTDQLGLDATLLEPEQFHVVSDNRHLAFIGRNPDESYTTLWAVDEFLDRYLSVRWLWPGDLGTHVPMRSSIVLPDRIDITGGPPLQQRRFRNRKDEEEVLMWLQRSRMGSRMSYSFGHSFGNWWEKYHEAHPDYFAVTPPSYTQPYPRPDWVKLNIGNPAVLDQIVEEWVEAGKPDNWNVCPNDGSGWCVGPASRALDPPEMQSMDSKNIFRGKANLTPRFVKFWNKLLKRMKELNPNVTISIYAYSSYRLPPTSLTLEPGMVIGICDGYDAYDTWRGWYDTGSKLVLRPNWWHIGAIAPHLPLHDAGEFFKYAYTHGMIGLDFDSLMGYWATQGPFCYLIGRLSVRPDLSVDDVLDEYAGAFGAAAAVIREYLAYWEDFTNTALYPTTVARHDSRGENSPYDIAVRKGGFSHGPLSASWRVLPYLFTDDVCDRAWAILQRARRVAVGDNAIVAERIRFLEDGLRHLRMTRDVIAMAYDPKYDSGSARERFIEKVIDLERFRVDLTRRHVVWGDRVNQVTMRRNIRTAPAGFELPASVENVR